MHNGRFSFGGESRFTPSTKGPVPKSWCCAIANASKTSGEETFAGVLSPLHWWIAQHLDFGTGPLFYRFHHQQINIIHGATNAPTIVTISKTSDSNPKHTDGHDALWRSPGAPWQGSVLCFSFSINSSRKSRTLSQSNGWTNLLFRSNVKNIATATRIALTPLSVWCKLYVHNSLFPMQMNIHSYLVNENKRSYYRHGRHVIISQQTNSQNRNRYELRKVHWRDTS